MESFGKQSLKIKHLTGKQIQYQRELNRRVLLYRDWRGSPHQNGNTEVIHICELQGAISTLQLKEQREKLGDNSEDQRSKTAELGLRPLTSGHSLAGADL